MGAGDLKAGMTVAPVVVRTVFERFPASVRGAVAIRGADADPHQVKLTWAAVVELSAPGHSVREVTVHPATVDIAPRKEVLIPFEVPLGGLDPGWYGVTADVEVDGNRTVRGPDDFGRRFLVPWPRGAVRRGTFEAGLRIPVSGSEGARIDRVDLKADRAVVRWRHAPIGEPGPELEELTVTADGRRLPLLESSFEGPTGARTTIVYPVPSSTQRLTFEVHSRGTGRRPSERGPWRADLDLG